MTLLGLLITLLLALTITLQGEAKKKKNDFDPPLLVTPILDKPNGHEEAQKLAEVKSGPFIDDIISYSGFFTVNKTTNSNLFFWFFKAENNSENAPIILWLQGGPGSSALVGLFLEIGPFMMKNKKKVKKNPWSWNKNYNLLFIDNPVGTGFSYTNDDGYSTDMTEVTDNLYEALIQFFKMFPELQNNDFYVSGQSFGGKYVPNIAYRIDQENQSTEMKINLKGISVGNGFCDPLSMLNSSELVYQLGLIDLKLKNELQNYEISAKDALKEERYVDAYNDWQMVRHAIMNATDFNTLFNYISQKQVKIRSAHYVTFVNSKEVRNLIHVGDLKYETSPQVKEKLIPNYMTSIVPLVEILVEKYKVLYYNGQTDLVFPYVLSLHNNLKWSARDEYDAAAREAWYVGKDLAGYRKKAGFFQEYLIRNAGHMVPLDQPKWAYNLITEFISQ